MLDRYKFLWHNDLASTIRANSSEVQPYGNRSERLVKVALPTVQLAKIKRLYYMATVVRAL